MTNALYLTEVEYFQQDIVGKYIDRLYTPVVEFA